MNGHFTMGCRLINYHIRYVVSDFNRHFLFANMKPVTVCIFLLALVISVAFAIPAPLKAARAHQHVRQDAQAKVEAVDKVDAKRGEYYYYYETPTYYYYYETPTYYYYETPTYYYYETPTYYYYETPTYYYYYETPTYYYYYETPSYYYYQTPEYYYDYYERQQQSTANLEQVEASS
ncbi:uncharacterized protein Gasu_09270 [Galdieria sulphuraria]|uniref:Uncharacterized protein n=1 Tax=Galdieria sulphuraria TaxID=130081 RepID=M2X5W1_GALSU|nr:uncharacterized protein Gasu_09270 [Galdieria sulphuraria]EME31855.1 hypothetical protein Gasu_09270 [Galdieria sulphuraria]|eukprot:XP_005708375.1 hypothetical protein Gasu_09270 [Galdieria sulphuraria]